MSDKKIVTPEATILYPNLFEPRAMMEGQEAKFSVMLVFDAGTDLSALKEAVMEEAKEKGLKGSIRKPLRPGSDKEGSNIEEVVKGKVFMNVTSKFMPKVIDRRKQDILDKDEVYSGMRARAVVRPYGYDSAGNRGVAFGFDLIQILGKGTRLELGGGGEKSVKLLDELPDGDVDPLGEDW